MQSRNYQVRALRVMAKIDTSENKAQFEDLVAEYLTIQDKIYQLILDINATHSKASFALTTANHLSSGFIKSFGQDYYDYRNRKALRNVSVGNSEMKLKSHLALSVKQKEPINHSQIRSRKTVSEKQPEPSKPKKQLDSLDPIKMFKGGLVPKQLVEAQLLNVHLVGKFTELVNARNQLAVTAKKLQSA